MPISPPLNTRRACIRQKLIQDLHALNAKPSEPETLNPEALNPGQYNPLYNPDMNPNLNSNIIPHINPSIILNISLYSPYISSPVHPQTLSSSSAQIATVEKRRAQHAAALGRVTQAAKDREGPPVWRLTNM